MFLANKLNKGAGSPAAATDPQFNYVTMLLHGDGTNGAQNNTFLDSSTNNSTITRNGNTTQGSFSPYGSNWSNYFNGSSTLSLADNAVFTLPADFTIEFWFFQTGAFQDRLIIDKWTEYYVYTRANGVIGLAWGPYNPSGMFGVGGIVQSGSNGFALNTWTHVAAVRNSNTFTLYINGVSVSTATNSATVTDTSAGITIGDYGGGGYAFEGYVSNARIVKGTAVYTANFTPSTTPLTAISGTSLLTCQSNRFVDNSSNAFTVTANGTPSVQRFNPFGASTAYSTSVIGGSGYFDGSGDYLSVPNPQSFAPGTGDWTVECWLYPISGNWAIISGSNFYINNNGGTVYVGDASVDIISVSPPTTNTWTHIATTKSGSTVRLFYNGTQVGSSTTAMSTSTTTSMVVGGRVSAGISLNGYMGGFRMVVGTAVYTSAFTPPSSPPTAITNTSLLLNYTNGAIFDNAMMNDLETAGNAQISTSVVKYGTGSLAFDGTGDYLTTLGNPLYAFGTGDFTIECWLNITSFSGGVVIDFRPPATSGDQLLVYFNGSTVELYASGATRIASGTLTLATWFHFALSRSGSAMKMFINGTQAGSTYTASVNYNVGPLLGIGTSTAILGSSFLNGYIDDMRITKGYARYTANFTPPTAAFPNIGPT